MNFRIFGVIAFFLSVMFMQVGLQGCGSEETMPTESQETMIEESATELAPVDPSREAGVIVIVEINCRCSGCGGRDASAMCILGESCVCGCDGEGNATASCTNTPIAQ